MMKWFFLALVIVPTLELALLIWAGGKIGFFPTIAIIVATGLVGAYLAKKKGLKAIRDVQEALNNFQAPADQLISAAFVLVGGILLLTPGFISDAVGFSMLFTPTQKLFKPIVYRLIQKKMRNARVIVQ
ncbi:FxsA family protein [Planococcus sp. N028]|uniref:FxsA family protein n=1 Tax=Planococcus shixiaomingii TaxID=3058393 RepID=A0ABT8MXA7_9BACL|nr:FxsA family protein [Planococcus sp. N028]MDN7240264.1 FxsA family protein [Planococcus sp. N028]